MPVLQLLGQEVMQVARETQVPGFDARTFSELCFFEKKETFQPFLANEAFYELQFFLAATPPRYFSA